MVIVHKLIFNYRSSEGLFKGPFFHGNHVKVWRIVPESDG